MHPPFPLFQIFFKSGFLYPDILHDMSSGHFKSLFFVLVSTLTFDKKKSWDKSYD